jgi:hypothetical protein
MVRLHQVDQAGVEDRPHAVFHDRPLLPFVFVTPMLEFTLADQIAGLGESRDPLAVHQHGVPAHMVRVQVGADHRVDTVPAPARIRQMLQERRRQRVTARQIARLVVADAGIDHQPQPRRLHEQRLDGRDERTILLGEVWKEPGAGLQRLRRRIPQEAALGKGDYHLDDAGDLHRAHLPAQHGVLLLLASRRGNLFCTCGSFGYPVVTSISPPGRLCQTADPRSDGARLRRPRRRDSPLNDRLDGSADDQRKDVPPRGGDRGR